MLRKRVDDIEIKSFLSAHAPVESGATIPVGALAGSWRIQAFLERGSAAEVYRAVHLSLPLEAAVKVLAAVGEAAKERFNQEAEFLKGEKHALLPRHLASGEIDGRPFTALELLHPVVLPRQDGDVAKFILAVSDGLLELRWRGFVHDGMTVADVMQRRNGEPVIVKLGRRKESAGKAEGKSPVSPDVQSLGGILKACFAGKTPRCWAGIIARATSENPAVRYRDVLEFMRAVKNRHRAKRLAIAAVVAAMVAAAAAAAWLFL